MIVDGKDEKKKNKKKLKKRKKKIKSLNRYVHVVYTSTLLGLYVV